MDIKGSYLLPCDPATAWAALNDPDRLKAALKGCEKLERTGETEFVGTVSTKIGPVSAKFSGKMSQTNIDPPHGCTMVFEGQGGIAGFAKGKADVRLEPEESGTRLSYSAQSQVGGRLAQMGARLLEGTAKSVADDFFARFSTGLAAPAPES